MAMATQSAVVALHPTASLTSPSKLASFARPIASLKQTVRVQVGPSKSRVRCAAGDVAAEGTNFLIGGAIAIALIGSAFPVFFSRKDTCPDCDGAGFVRAGGAGALRANAARKDQQIVCKTCKGLGKLNQVDKD